MYQASIPFILNFKDKVNKITIKNNEPRLIMETMYYERTIKSLIFIVSQNGSQSFFKMPLLPQFLTIFTTTDLKQ